MRKMRAIQSQVPTLRPVITGKLVESLDILTLHTLALLQYVEKEAEDNPFIEYDEQGGQAIIEKKKDFMTEEVESWHDIGSVDVERSESRNFIEPPDTKETLYDRLLVQTNVLLKEEAQLEIAKEIVYSLDERGWLSEGVEEIANRMGVNREDVKEVLNKIKSLEPAGVGASNLKECLLIQLEREEGEGTLAHKILKNAFDDLLSLNKRKLAKRFAVSVAEIEDALSDIYKLDPMPGRHYSGIPQYVSPDAIIERVPFGDKEDYKIYLPEFNIPHIHLSSTYKRLIERVNSLSPEEKDYLMNKLQRAKNLLVAIEQRKETIRTITEYIKDKERDFLSGRGLPQLITEEEVADDIGIHVSTVSRAIKDKWIETPRGMFRFSYFFSHGRKEEYHWILLLMEEMVKKEDKRHPLSDVKISRILKEKGFNVARTTVVKYRNLLGIPSSSKRRLP